MLRSVNVLEDKGVYETIKDAEELAIQLADESRAFIRDTRHDIRVLYYKDNDPRNIVTNLDVAIENLDKSAIQKRFPKHNIISEESGDLKIQSPWTWRIDAVDGTKNAETGFPVFASSIALQYEDELVLGVITADGDIYSAVRGEGAFLNGREICVSGEGDLSKMYVFTDTARIDKISEEEYDEVARIQRKLDRNTYRVRRFGCGSLELCRIAAGIDAAYFDITGYEPFYDVAAGLLLVEEAGGKTSNRYGNKLINNARYATASNGLIHEALLKLINE